MVTPFPKTIGMTLEELWQYMEDEEQTLSKSFEPRELFRLIEDMSIALGDAQRAFTSPFDSFIYQDHIDTFQRNLGAIERRLREAIETSSLERVESPYYHGGVTYSLRAPQ